MADRYWVGGTAIWDGTVGTKWSATSGGSGGASIPTSADSVFFDQAGPYTVQLGASTYQTLNCLDFTISGANVTLTSVAGPPNIFIYGSFSIASTTVWNATQIIGNFVATTTGKTINSNGVTVNFNNIIFNGAGGGWTLSGAFTVGTTRTITLTAGALDIAGFTLSTGLFSSNNSNTRSIAFGAGFIALTSTVSATTVLQMSTLTNFSSTGTGGFSSATNVTKTFSSGFTAGGSQTTGPNMFVTAGTLVVTLNGTSWWNTLSFVGSTSTVNATGSPTLVHATNLILGSGTSYFITSTPIFNTTFKGNTKGLSGVLTVNDAAVTFTFDTSGGSCFVSSIVLGAGKITSTGAGEVRVSTSVAHSGGELALNGGIWNTSTSGTGNYTYTGGTITDIGGATLTISTIAGSGNFVLNGPTLSLPISATTIFRIARNFTLTSGTLSLSANSSIFNTTATTLGGMQLNGGNIVLNNFELTIGIFTSENSTVRSVSFGTGNIIISYTGAVTLLGLSILTNITLTGTGGFVIPVSAASTVVVCGTTGGTTTNAPNLRFSTGSGSPTITTGSWFNTLDFGTSSFTVAATSLNLNSLILGSGTYTGLTANMRGAGTINTNTKPCILVINNDVNTTTCTAATNASTFTMTAGTINFATFNLTCTTTATYTNGTLSNIGTITCTTFTVSTGTFTLTSGNITPSTSVVISSSGTFNYNNGTLGPVGTFTQTLGTMNFNKSYSLTSLGLYTLTAGSLTLNGFNLTVGRFASTNTNTRSISFGSGNIIMSTTNSGQVCLDMATTTNFTLSGTGGFTSPMNVPRTFQFGTTGGSSSIAPNLTLTSGSSAPTFTTNSWFNKLDFSGTTGGTIPAFVTVNVNSLTLAALGTYTNLTVNVVSTGTIISNGNTTLITLVINAPGGTVSAGDAFTTNTASGGITLTAGTFNLNGYNPTLGAFTSSNTNTRSIDFGANTIILALTSGTCLQMSTVTNFTWTGTGGFSVASGSSRITNFGSVAGGTASNAPNLTITGSAALTFSLTANSWYNKIDFGTSSVIISTLTVNFNSITASANVTYTGLTSIIQGTGNIITNGRTFGPITINHSGTTTLGDALTTNGTTTMTSGTLNLAGFTMTTPTLSSSSSSARSITGAGTLAVTGSWSVSDGTNFTGNNYTINMTSASGKTFDGAGGIYGNLVQAGAGALTISGSNQLNNISANTRPSTISFTAGTTQTLTNFTLSGTAGNSVTINSVTSGTQFNLLKTSGTVDVNYLTISDSNVSAAFFSNLTSVNSGNNTGWNFTSPAVVQAGFSGFF